MEQLQQQLLETGTKIIGVIVSLLVAYITANKAKLIELAKTKINAIKDEKVREITTNAFNTLDTLIETNIVNAENKLKPAILQAIADGKVTKDELNNLSTVVKDDVLKQLGEDSTKALSSSLGDVDSFVSARIEKILAELKDAEGTAVEKTIIETTTTTASSEEITSQTEQNTATLNIPQ